MKKLAIFFVSLFLLVGFAVAVAPNIESIADQTVAEGAAYSYQVEASDADNDALTYSLSTAPAGMSIDSSTGLITWTASGSTTSVTVNVTDGSEIVSESFTLTVQPSQPGIEFAENTVKFGDSETERGSTLTQTVVVTNTGTQTLTSVTVEIQNPNGQALPIEYKQDVQLTKQTLSPGESANVIITLEVPLNKDSREQTIGRARIQGVGTNSITVSDDITISMEAKSYLEITDVELDVDGDEESIDDGETYDEIKEGNEVTVKITVENTYDDDDKEIEDVRVTMDADDNNWDIDNEDSDREDIEGDDDQEFEITFTIGDDIDDDKTQVTVSVEGDDKDNNFEHYDEITFEFELDREDDEVTITSIDIGRSSYSCDDNFADIEVTIKNTGQDDQDEVTLQLVSDDLDWNRRIREIELDDGERETYDFRIPLEGADSTSDYFVDIEAFVNDDDRTDSDVGVISVVCSETNDIPESTTRPSRPITPPVEEETVIVVTPPSNDADMPTTNTNPNVVYGEPIGTLDSVRTSNLYVVLLIALLVLVLLAIVLLGGKLLKN